MNTNSNIRFGDWEAEQMQDPELRAAVEELEPVYQMARGWEIFRQGILALQEVMTETLVPAFQQVIGAIRAFVIQLQRTQLRANLIQRWWIPEHLAYWLSDRWPERWLPELRFVERSD